MEARKIIAIAMMACVGIAVWRMNAMQEQGAGHVRMQQEGAEFRLISDENEEAVSLPIEDARLFGSIEPILRSQQIVPWKEAATLERHVPMSAAVLEKIIQEIPWIREVHNQMREGETEKQAAARIVMTMPRLPFDLDSLQEAIACAQAADYLNQPALEQRYACEIAGMVTSKEALTLLAENDPELIALISDSSIPSHLKRAIFHYMQTWIETLTVQCQAEIRSIAISADGDTVVAGSRGAEIVSRNRALYIIEPEAQFRSVAISADGDTVVTGAWDGKARIGEWNGVAWAIQDPITHKNAVDAVAISAGGNTVVTGSKDGTAQIVERIGALWENQHTIEFGNWVSSVAISEDGNTVVAGSWDKKAKIAERIRDVWVERATIVPSGVLILSVAISADGNTVVTGSSDGMKIVARNGDVWAERYTSRRGSVVNSVAISADGNRVVMGCGGMARIVEWNKTAWVDCYTIAHQHAVNSVAISADGNTVVTGSRDKTVKIMTRNGTVWGEHTIEHQDEVKSVAISADGNRVATGCVDGTTKIIQLLPADTFDQALFVRLLESVKRQIPKLNIAVDGWSRTVWNRYSDADRALLRSTYPGMLPAYVPGHAFKKVVFEGIID